MNIANNFLFKNPLGITMGHQQADHLATGMIVSNVVVGTQDIGIHPLTPARIQRGFGINVGRVSNVQVRDNIVALAGAQTTGNTFGLSLVATVEQVDVTGNLIYQWFNPETLAGSALRTGYGWEERVHAGSVRFWNNEIDHRVGAASIFSSRDTRPQNSVYSFENNLFRTIDPLQILLTDGSGSDLTADQFKAFYGNSNRVDSQILPERREFVTPEELVESYMQSLGLPGRVDLFIQMASQQSRFRWNDRFTADQLNRFVRRELRVK